MDLEGSYDTSGCYPPPPTHKLIRLLHISHLPSLTGGWTEGRSGHDQLNPSRKQKPKRRDRKITHVEASKQKTDAFRLTWHQSGNHQYMTERTQQSAVLRGKTIYLKKINNSFIKLKKRCHIQRMSNGTSRPKQPDFRSRGLIVWEGLARGCKTA
jgi:hypothetical protein